MIVPDIRTAAVTNKAFAFTFFGERGIPYAVHSNVTLSASEWGKTDIVPLQKGETNGVFLFEVTVPLSGGQHTGFYRVRSKDAE